MQSHTEHLLWRNECLHRQITIHISHRTQALLDLLETLSATTEEKRILFTLLNTDQSSGQYSCLIYWHGCLCYSQDLSCMINANLPQPQLQAFVPSILFIYCPKLRTYGGNELPHQGVMFVSHWADRAVELGAVVKSQFCPGPCLSAQLGQPWARVPTKG